MSIPLLSPRAAGAPLAWRGGSAVAPERFVAEALALAETLPRRGRPVNLCRDRYAFALGYAAALLRGQTSLMPPNALPATLAALATPGGGGDAYALVDDDGLDTGGLAAVVVDPDAFAATPSAQMPRVAGDLDAVCLLTSGSTGAPQPHGKRAGQLAANIAAEAARLAELLRRPDLTGLALVATVPPQHSYGFESSVLLALLGGATLVAGRPFYPADIAAALAALPRPRALVTTPFHLKTLLLAGVELPAVELVLSATAPLSPQLAAEAESRLGATLVEIYGCTEAGQVAARRTTAGDVWTTLDGLTIAAAGDDGCVVQGGHVGAPTPLADVLELFDERRFRLLGRANDLVRVAGKRSSLAHLNFQLNRIDGVVDGSFWMPDDDAARPDGVVRPVAFVVAPALTARQVIAGLRERIEPAFVPRRVVHVDALPRAATGKLTAEALARFAAATLASLPVALTIAADHPAFAGHFPPPGRPLLPGAALLGLVLQALRRRPALARRLAATPTIEQVKFLLPVGPGDRLSLAFKPEGGGVGFDVRRSDDGAAVARGKLA